MVCARCVLSVETILERLSIPVSHVGLGIVALESPLGKKQEQELEKELNKVGFELIESRQNQLIEKIKGILLHYLNSEIDTKQNISELIGEKLPYDYSYLSDLFSSAEGRSIEQYYIAQRIEKAKELLVYNQLSLTEIAYQLGFSSVHHLSAQFKKVTGLTPSRFKTIGSEKRKAQDNL